MEAREAEGREAAPTAVIVDRALLLAVLAGASPAAARKRIQELQARTTEATAKITRLYKLVEDGVAEIDTQLLTRISDLQTERDLAQATLDRAKLEASPIINIDPAAVEAFGILMKTNITMGPVQFRKAYIRSVVSRIEVDTDTIRIIEHKDKLERLVKAGAAAFETGSQMSTNWRTREDSNL